MEAMGIEKIETGAGKLQIAKSPISVDIIDVESIPDEYKQVVTEIKVDKKKIYLCKIIGKRDYVTKNNETYYYLKFLINDEEREFLVAKDKYDIFTEGMNGQLTLLLDKVFIDFTII